MAIAEQNTRQGILGLAPAPFAAIKGPEGDDDDCLDGLGDLVRNHTAQRYEEKREVVVTEESKLYPLLKKYEAFLEEKWEWSGGVVSPANHNTKIYKLNDVLTPEEINEFLQITVAYEDHQHYSMNTGIFLTRLIWNSYGLGHNHFYLNVAPSKKLDMLVSNIRATPENPLYINIDGSVGKIFIGMVEYINAVINGDAEIVNGNGNIVYSNITINGVCLGVENIMSNSTFKLNKVIGREGSIERRGVLLNSNFCLMDINELELDSSSRYTGINCTNAYGNILRTRNKDIVEALLANTKNGNRVCFIDEEGNEHIIREFAHEKINDLVVKKFQEALNNGFAKFALNPPSPIEPEEGDNIEKKQHLFDEITDVLSPEALKEIPSKLTYLSSWMGRRFRYFFGNHYRDYVGLFMNRLIQNSYNAGYNNFEIENCPYISSFLKGSADKPIQLAITNYESFLGYGEDVYSSENIELTICGNIDLGKLGHKCRNSKFNILRNQKEDYKGIRHMELGEESENCCFVINDKIDIKELNSINGHKSIGNNAKGVTLKTLDRETYAALYSKFGRNANILLVDSDEEHTFREKIASFFIRREVDKRKKREKIEKKREEKERRKREFGMYAEDE